MNQLSGWRLVLASLAVTAVSAVVSFGGIFVIAKVLGY